MLDNVVDLALYRERRNRVLVFERVEAGVHLVYTANEFIPSRDGYYVRGDLVYRTRGEQRECVGLAQVVGRRRVISVDQ